VGFATTDQAIELRNSEDQRDEGEACFSLMIMNPVAGTN